MAVLDDFNIDYNGKRIYHNSGTTVWDVNDLYSALQDTFDELAQMDDDVPMSAQTPTEYTLINGWYMNSDDMQYLKNGAIQTTGWDSYGMVKVDYSAETVQLVPGDKGLACSTTSYNGVLVDYVDNGTTGTVWIRPDTASDTFDSAELLTCDTGQVTLSAASNVTGNQLWANPFSLGTIQPDTTLYVVQDNAVVPGYWPEGHLDILLLVKDMGVEIANGVIEVFAHKPGTNYDHFQIDLTTGGRQPVPLATSSDINDQDGYRTLTTDAETGAGWSSSDIGVVIQNQADTTTKGIITSVTGTGPNYTVEYFALGDLTDHFADNDVIEDVAQTKTMTQIGASAVANIATNDWNVAPAFAFQTNAETWDTGSYAVTIDCTGYTNLQEVYQRMKYDTRRGDTGTINGVEGEEFVGMSIALSYTPGTDPTTIGQVMTGGTSGATGVLAAVDPTGDVVYLHNVKGSFTDTETVTGASDGTLTNIVSSTVALNKTCPFATFAGGTMFTTQGVRLINVPTADKNSYFQTDLSGTSHSEPIQRTVTVNSVEIGDRILLVRRTGTAPIQDEYLVSGVHNIGDQTITMQASIATDKPAAGVVRINKADGTEMRYRYASYTGAILTLDDMAGTATGGSATTLVYATGGFTAGVKIGDVVYNTTEAAFAYVVSVDNDTTLTLTSSSVVDWNGDGFTINRLAEALANGDEAYIPILDLEATATSASTTIIYSTDRDVSLRVRKKGILPFTQDTTIEDANLTLSAIRTDDNIVTI